LAAALDATERTSLPHTTGDKLECCSHVSKFAVKQLWI
jgi:hypothetical protein